MNGTRDSDDWFEADETRGSRAPETVDRDGADEDWLQDLPLPTRPWYETIDRRVVVIAGLGIVFLIAVLAAAGVFSSSPQTSPPPPPITTPIITASTTETTTTTATQSVPAPAAALKPGDTGTQVKVLQRALAHLGFSPGTVDGQYGPATEAAVEQFQTSVKLTADGIVGPKTLAALTTALHRG
jgi:Putative peptidoglycan binding domain